MMVHLRPFVRSLLALVLVTACFAALVIPFLEPARAAPNSIPSEAPGDLVISSFRFIGPKGEADEFIEVFNRSCSTSYDLNNYTFKYSDAGASFFLLKPNFASISVIQPGHYFLLTNPGDGTHAGYSETTAADATYALDSPPGLADIPSSTGGVAIFNAAGAIVDQVGFSNGVDAYFEGDAIGPIQGTDEQGIRKVSAAGAQAGAYVDTNNNLRDFAMAAPSAPHNSADTTGKCGIPTQTISGNTGIGNVTLTYRDIFNAPQIATSNGSGNYTITVDSNWAGTITPVRTGYTFNPANRPYTGVLSDLTGQDFAATLTPPTPTPVPFYKNVVINEIAWSGTSYSNADQWIELYNTLPYAVDIGGWTLSDTEFSIGTDGTLTFTKANSPDGKTEPVIPAHGFFVIAKNKYVFQNLTPDYIDPNMDLPSCSVLTYCGDQFELHGSPEPPMYGNLIDTANGTSFHWLAGSLSNHRSMERAGPNGPVADSSRAWLTYIGSPVPPSCPAHPNVKDRAGNRVQGTPGCPNWASIVTPTPLPTSTTYRYKTATPRPPTPFGHMVINEFLPRAGYDWNQDGVVDVYDEFVEIKNLGPVAAQLSGWRLDVISPGGPSSYSLPSITLQPDQRAVYYGLTSHLSLYDSGGTVRLINNRGIIVDARSYGAVQNPDQSTCRIPDGFYWRFPCFPTPGLENSLTGTLPVPPPVIASQPPPCLLADTVPDPFKEAECYGFGQDVFNPAYWDDQAGFNSFPVPDALDKHRSVVK